MHRVRARRATGIRRELDRVNLAVPAPCDIATHPNHHASMWLGDLLENPPLSGGFTTLREHWKECEITVTCVRPTGLRPGDWMVYALRGAVGGVLFERELPMPGRASAWQALFSTKHAQVRQRQVPSPLLLDILVGKNTLTITARLFGFASIWRDSFLGALISALNSGVSVYENSSERKPWRVIDFNYFVHRRLPEAFADTRMRCLPRGPLCYGAKQHRKDEPERFVLAALGRVGPMARWQRVRLAFEPPTLEAIRRSAVVRKGLQGRVVRLQKHSRRHSDSILELQGEATELLFDIRNPEWRDALAIASECCAGGHVSYGFGRFDLTAW